MSKISPRLQKLLVKIKALLLDVEGVLIGDVVILNAEGLDTKAFSAADANAITRAQERGIRIGILTSSHSPIIAERARELAIHDIYQGSFNKLELYEEFKNLYGYADEEIAYIGDDILDIPVLKRVGFSATPPAAHPHAKLTAHYVAKQTGGNGAVGEVIELLLSTQPGGN